MSRDRIRASRVLTAMLLALTTACTSTAGSGSFGGDPATGTSGGASGAAPSPTRTPATPTVSTLDFADCTDQIKPQIKDQPGGDRDLSFGCARLPVPLDHTNPSGKTIDLFVVRVRLAGQKQRIGSMLVNPGGPGGSGLDAAIGLGLSLSPDLLRRFDVVGFDPRGVGLSAGLECIPADLKDEATSLDPDAKTPAQYAKQVSVAKQMATACSGKYGADLGHYNTEETARDIDLVRQGVGDDTLTYLGYSYGTRLGSVYAHLFPAKVRAMVLDGAVDPVAGEVASAETQAKGFENAYTQFGRACAARANCLLGDDPRGFLANLLDQARKTPIRSSKAGEKRTATAGYVLLAAVSALYDEDQWPDLESALAEAKRGDATGVFELADQYSQRSPDGTYSNILDANLTINCSDTDEKPSDATVRGALASWRQKYPLFGTTLALGLLTCQQWTAPRHPLPTVTATGAKPILVIGTKNDPATPYASAQVLARQLKSGRLLTWNGEGHTAYPKTTCVTRAVNGYLINLTLPKDGTTCPVK